VPSISALVDEIAGIPKPFRGALARLLGFDQLERIYDSTTKDRPITEQFLNRLAVTYRVSELDLQQIPRTGATVIVANHPFGILEGAVLATVLERIRPDVRFLANQMLSAIPEIRDFLIPVDVLGGNAQGNSTSLRGRSSFSRTAVAWWYSPQAKSHISSLQNGSWRIQRGTRLLLASLRRCPGRAWRFRSFRLIFAGRIVFCSRCSECSTRAFAQPYWFASC